MAPVLNPETQEPTGPADFEAIFPMALVQQEMSTECHIPIPEPVRDVYRLWRPTPLYRAHRWEETLDTPAKIFYKYEDFRAGELEDFALPEEEIEESLAAVPSVE